jgi:hypothetical protein
MASSLPPSSAIPRTSFDGYVPPRSTSTSDVNIEIGRSMSATSIGSTGSASSARRSRPSFDLHRVRNSSQSRQLADSDLHLATLVSAERERSSKSLTKENVQSVVKTADDDDLDVTTDDFERSEGLTSEVAHKKLLFYGKNELPEKRVPKYERSNYSTLLAHHVVIACLAYFPLPPSLPSHLQVVHIHIHVMATYACDDLACDYC